MTYPLWIDFHPNDTLVPRVLAAIDAAGFVSLDLRLIPGADGHCSTLLLGLCDGPGDLAGLVERLQALDEAIVLVDAVTLGRTG